MKRGRTIAILIATHSVVALLAIVVWTSLTRAKLEKPEDTLPTRKISAELDWLSSANPCRDAERAIRKADLTFLAYQGYALWIPGVADSVSKAIIREGDYGVLPGTTDAIMSPEHREQLAIARAYARWYNEKILAARPVSLDRHKVRK
jgi:hypothetical protein